VAANAGPSVIWRASSWCARSPVSGRAVSTSRPRVTWPTASTLAERCRARSPAAASRVWPAHSSRLGVVVRQHFGLRLDSLRELRLQDLRNALVILLTGAPQQGLIGGILYQGMLKEVGRLGSMPRW